MPGHPANKVDESSESQPSATAPRDTRRKVSWYRRLVVHFLGYDFFISYCHETEGFVRELHARLSRHRVCFLDRAPEGIQAGTSIGDSIKAALKRSKILVVVYSPAVEVNEWPRAECRYFRSACPDRRIIPISPDPYSDQLPQVLFQSNLQRLQPELDRWLAADGVRLPDAVVPEDQQLAIVESEASDLRIAQPSDATVQRLIESHTGTAVPMRARQLIAATTIVVSVLMLGVWMYYASTAAAQIVDELRKSPYGSANIEEVRGALDAGHTLRTIIRAPQLRNSAREHGLSNSEEWQRVCQQLQHYHRYRWWSSLGFRYHGLALELHGIPDLLPDATNDLPDGLVDVRYYGQTLPESWIRHTGRLTTLKLLAVSVKSIEEPSVLAEAIDNLRLTELRLSKAPQITLSWLDGITIGAFVQLQTVRLSNLPQLQVQSPYEEALFARLFIPCQELSHLTLDQLHGCRFSDSFLVVLLNQNPSLCNNGTIEIDPTTVATNAITAAKSATDCNCDLQLMDFPDL